MFKYSKKRNLDDEGLKRIAAIRDDHAGRQVPET
jgi:hypothetical protein